MVATFGCAWVAVSTAMTWSKPHTPGATASRFACAVSSSLRPSHAHHGSPRRQLHPVGIPERRGTLPPSSLNHRHHFPMSEQGRGDAATTRSPTVGPTLLDLEMGQEGRCMQSPSVAVFPVALDVWPKLMLPFLSTCVPLLMSATGLGISVRSFGV